MSLLNQGLMSAYRGHSRLLKAVALLGKAFARRNDAEHMPIALGRRPLSLSFSGAADPVATIISVQGTNTSSIFFTWLVQTTTKYLR